MILNSLVTARATQWRASGKSLLDFTAHELRAVGLSVTVEEDYLSVAVDLPFMTINIIPDGPGNFELHIEESIGGPCIDVTDKHVGPVPDAFVTGAVMGIKGQLEAYSASLSAIQKDPQKAALMGLRAANRARGIRKQGGKKPVAEDLIRNAGDEGIPADELCKRLEISLTRLRTLVSRLNRPRFVIGQDKSGRLMVRYIGRGGKR